VYSAILDWRTGEKNAFDFTTGTHIDVYDGNINTLKNMQLQHPNKYHTMMADIYAKVRCAQYSFDNNQHLSGCCQLDGWQ
jgi:hypothetical protein